MNLDHEQKEILELSDKLDKIRGRSWAKYKGDVINRKIIKLISSHIDGVKYFVAGPSVFVDGLSTEFDALIVKKTANTGGDRNAYLKDDVKLVIEVKKHGFYFKKIEGGYEIREYFKQYLNANIPFVYLSVKESGTFIKITEEVIPTAAFFLGVSGKKIINGGWQRFIEKILLILK